jgi:Spy/CpxP family protein refolding chaperone
MRMRHLNELLIVAILLISTASLYAQRQQQDVAKLKADARNAVGIIGGDQAKTKTYCQIVDLSRQINQAGGQKDRKKARALAHEMDQLQKQLPEFDVLSNTVERADLTSSDGREITLIIQSLSQSCPE